MKPYTTYNPLTGRSAALPPPGTMARAQREWDRYLVGCAERVTRRWVARGTMSEEEAGERLAEMRERLGLDEDGEGEEATA